MYQHNLKGYSDSKRPQSKVDTRKVSVFDCLSLWNVSSYDLFLVIENINAANIFRGICLSKAIFCIFSASLVLKAYGRHSIGSVWLHSVCGEPRKFNV